MGQEIVYCFKCQKRVLGQDFARGQAYQLGNNVSCSSCAAELLQTLGPRDREQLMAKMFKATQDRQSASATNTPTLPAATPPPHRALSPSSTRVKALAAVGAAPRRATPAGSPGVVIGVVAAVAAVVVILLVALSGGNSPPPESGTTPKAPKPPAVTREGSRESPEQARRREEAKKAVQKAREFATTSPLDVAGQALLWEQARPLSENTPYAEDVKRELSRLAARRKELLAKELGELEAQLGPKLRAEEFKAAADFLAAALARRDAPEWSEAVERRAGEIRDAASRLFPAVRDAAVEAQKRHASAEVKLARDRVLKWGFPEFAADLQSALEAAVPAGDAALVGSWPLDAGSGGEAADVSGKSGRAVLKKGATWTAGRAGPAVLFDGSGAHLELPNSPELDKLQENSYTIAVWFRPDALPTDPKEPSWGGASAIFLKGPFREGLIYTHAGKFLMVHWMAGVKWSSAGTWADTFAPGAWYHVAGVVDREAGKDLVYVNGKLRGTESIPKNAPGQEFGPEKWTAGKVRYYADPDYPAKGAVSDLRLFARALEAREVEALVTSPARPAGAPDERPWKRLVDGRSLDGLNGKGYNGWNAEGEYLVKDLKVDQAAQTRDYVTDGLVRIRFEIRNSSVLWFCLRQDGPTGYRVAFHGNETPNFGPGVHEILFDARGETVTATFDGKPRAVETGGKGRSGCLQFNSSAGSDFRIVSIDYLPAK